MTSNFTNNKICYWYFSSILTAGKILAASKNEIKIQGCAKFERIFTSIKVAFVIFLKPV